MRQLAYPFTDRRWLWVALVTVSLNILLVGMLVTLMGATLWLGPVYGQSRGSALSTLEILWLGVIFFFYIGAFVTGVIYLGALVATNREGWRRTGRLPRMRWGQIFREGLAAGIFTGLALLLPYLAVLILTAGLVAAVFGVSGLLAQAHHDLGITTGMVGLGGAGLAFVLGASAVIMAGWLVVPLLQARYAATGQLSSYFRFLWAARTIAKAPSKFLLYQSPTLLFLGMGTVLYLITLGFGQFVLMMIFPFVQLNQAYLMGHFYGEVVDPSLGDITAAQGS